MEEEVSVQSKQIHETFTVPTIYNSIEKAKLF